jgi:hypothetical protein
MRRPWSAADRALMRSMYPHAHSADVAAFLQRAVNQVYGMAAYLGLKKTQAYLESIAAGRIQRGRSDPRLLATQFKPGIVPWNKDTHYQAGGRSPLTQFKKGERHGRAAQLWVPLGSHRINGDGYLDRKISELCRGAMDWEAVHRLVWIEQMGPIPAKHVIVFRPGMFTTRLEEITVDRLECIHRGELARRNHPRNKSPELAKLVQLKGAITRQVNRIAREAGEKGTHHGNRARQRRRAHSAAH